MTPVEKKLDEAISHLIETAPRKELPELKYYYPALEKMNEHVWTRFFPKIPSQDPLAFVTRSAESSGVYKVYINPYVSEGTSKFLLLHEFGHVLCTHMEMPVLQEQILINKITYYWPMISSSFKDSQIFNEYVIDDLAHTLLNIAQDLEINGKFFSRKEWDAYNYNAQIDYINAEFHSKNCKPKDKIRIFKWLNTPEDQREKVFMGCHPSEYHFPVGLDYSQYVDLLIQNHEEFFKQLKTSCLKGTLIAMDNQEQGKLTTEEIDKLRNQFNDTNEAASEKSCLEAEAAEEEDAWKEHGVKGFTATGKTKFKKKGNGGKKSNSCIDIENTKALEAFILQNCYSKSIVNTRNDTMYYYNRKKYNNNIMISKQNKEELYRPGNLYLLIDCSGSISKKSIDIMIKLIQRLAMRLQKNSRIIWWSTQLDGDFSLRNAQGPQGSGGTDIAGGIKYIRENYLKNSNDKLIVISDYYDSLTHWYNEIIKIRNDCMGICWTFQDLESQSVENYIQGCGFNCNDSAIVDNFLKVLPTICVNVA